MTEPFDEALTARAHRSILVSPIGKNLVHIRMRVERYKRSIGLLSRLGRFPACSCNGLGIKLGLRKARVAVDGAVKKRRLRRSHVCSRSAMRLKLRDSKLLVVLCASCWNEDNKIWAPGNGRLLSHARQASRWV